MENEVIVVQNRPLGQWLVAIFAFTLFPLAWAAGRAGFIEATNRDFRIGMIGWLLLVPAMLLTPATTVRLRRESRSLCVEQRRGPWVRRRVIPIDDIERVEAWDTDVDVTWRVLREEPSHRARLVLRNGKTVPLLGWNVPIERARRVAEIVEDALSSESVGWLPGPR